MIIQAKRIGIDARLMLMPLRGMPLYVTRLCQYLPQVNKEHQLLYFINKGYEHNDRPENYLPLLDALEAHPNVRLINKDDEAQIRWEQVFLPRLARKHKIDLLHMPGNRVPFFADIPLVATVHDVMEYRFLLDQKYPISWSQNRSLRMLQYNLRRRLYAVLTYRYGMPRALRLITVSNYSADDIASTLSVDKQYISVIHHGVDREYLQERPCPREQRSHTLMLGGDSYQKNPEAALACWAQVSPIFQQQYPLKIIGFSGTESSSLLQALKKFGLDEAVEVKGWVPQPEMVEYMKHAVLFLFPSRYEGFGFPLIQAMACGTPVISTNKSSIPEVLGEVGFQLDPDDSIGMSKAVEQLLSDSNLWLQQSKAGFIRSKQFVWENSARKHLDLYEELLCRRQ